MAWTIVAGVVILIIVGIVSLFGACSNHNVHVTCLRLHENTERPTKVARSGLTTECYVQTPDGNWIPSERYRGTDDD